MIKSDKIREYFRTHPEAEVTKVAAKFKASKPMVYKLRKQVLDSMCEDPEMVAVPEPGTGRKVLVSSRAMAMAAQLGLSVKEYIEEDALAQGLVNSDGWGVMNGYDGQYDSEEVNGVTYYIMRIN